jgi:hypothetical protein
MVEPQIVVLDVAGSNPVGHPSLFRALSKIPQPCGWEKAAVLLGFGFVFAQSQAACGHAPSLSLAKTPKFLAAT